MVYAAASGDGNAIYLAETEPQVPGAKPILKIEETSAFHWSPTRDEVAVAEAPSRSGPPIFEKLTVVSSDGTAQKDVAEREIRLVFSGLPTETRSFTLHTMKPAGH